MSSTSNVVPASLSWRDSPTQKTAPSLTSIALFNLARVTSWVSPNRDLLSEWPIKVHLAPISSICSAVVSPVNAPNCFGDIFWDPI